MGVLLMYVLLNEFLVEDWCLHIFHLSDHSVSEQLVSVCRSSGTLAPTI